VWRACSAAVALLLDSLASTGEDNTMQPRRALPTTTGMMKSKRGSTKKRTGQSLNEECSAVLYCTSWAESLVLPFQWR